MDQVASVYHKDLPAHSYTTLSASLEGMRMQRVPQETGQIIMLTASRASTRAKVLPLDLESLGA
jgi:hypothetical protein